MTFCSLAGGLFLSLKALLGLAFPACLFCSADMVLWLYPKALKPFEMEEVNKGLTKDFCSHASPSILSAFRND